MHTSIIYFMLTGFAGLVVARAASVPIEKRSTVCYGDLGCFSNGGAFTSLHRPVNLNPQPPSSINPRFLLFTRQNHADAFRHFLNADDFTSIHNSDFKSTRATKVISHGFLENGLAHWMMEMKNELLNQGDYNVILLDWGGGSGIPYTQATANTRVVGAELAKLIKVLQGQASAKAQDFHLIGHSLGAHICGYAGERTPNLGRISGLDPAQPYFQSTDPSVRLDPTDATFVDVMHTNGDSILKLGYGMSQSCGHVDYFPNEGLHQPGCDASPIDKLRVEEDIYAGAKEIVACSHLRAHKYFTESINSKCQFNGYACKNYQEFQRGSCLPCSSTDCGFMGFHADQAKPDSGHKQYFLLTGANTPFCRYHYKIDIQFGQLPSSKSEKGIIYMNVFGRNGQTGEQPLSSDSLDISPGQRYSFVVTSTHDLGDITQVGFRWHLDSHWYNPLTWGSLTHHSLHINAVVIVSGQTNARSQFCGFDAEIESNVSKTSTKLC